MLRLRQICLVASEIEKPVDDLTAVFGLAICHHDPAVEKYGLTNALLPVGTNFLEVVAPFRDGTAAGRYLGRREGDGGYMVILQCDDAETRATRMEAIGVRIANRLDYGTYVGLQLHPKDTGGAILETSTDPRSDAPDGPWHPAGDDWKKAVRTDVTKRMSGVEVQSPEPRALAARWSEVLNIDVSENSSGQPMLQLENAVLRFVPVEDGRGEGLAGLDLEVADRETILRNATNRGCAVDGDIVQVCGIRFRLV